jgi:multidrug transporter EmrE-like cation transporter
MSIQIMALVLLSVAMSSIAQVILKTGMSSPAVEGVIRSCDPVAIALAISTNAWVLGGLSLYFLSAIIWLFVLARVEVSQAYPFVGIGFIITMLMGRFLLGDEVSLSRFAGTILVALGVALIART